MKEMIYDMVIVGGGPGGYTAALYGARAGLKVIVLEKMSAGGQIALTHQVDNYPGFVDGIDGFTLGMNMQQQAHRFGAETAYVQVTKLELEGKIKRVHTDSGVFLARTVSLSTGAAPRTLGIPMEQELTGQGVHYCAACDGMFYRGKTVVVVGGGNSAAADALVLSRIAKKVILVHRRDTLRATKIYHEQLMQAQNVEFMWDSAVKEILHNGKVTGLKIQNLRTGEWTEVACDGIFVSVGRKPASELAAGQLALDEGGYIIAGETTATSIPGVYAVGDVRTKQLRQVVTAVADGAAAAHMAEEYLSIHLAA
jgi:thioredoxin reductase (NADPH)